MIREIIFLQYWCLNLFMGLCQPTFQIGLLWISMLTNGYDTWGSDMELYHSTLRKEAYRNMFMYKKGLISDTGWMKVRTVVMYISKQGAYFQVTRDQIMYDLKKMGVTGNDLLHDAVIKWKHFPRNWPFVRVIHRSRWIPRTKASNAGLWCFLWSASE